jgi:hypothetical protein
MARAHDDITSSRPFGEIHQEIGVELLGSKRIDLSVVLLERDTVEVKMPFPAFEQGVEAVVDKEAEADLIEP